jgi:hypothetical protein
MPKPDEQAVGASLWRALVARYFKVTELSRNVALHSRDVIPTGSAGHLSLTRI